MNELLEKGQVISVVPQNFRNSNKGKIEMIRDSFFTIEMLHEPAGIERKKVMEFYSPTKNGTVYFNSSIVKVEGNTVVVSMPRKHRFLQRRTFTRVKFVQEVELKLGDKAYKATSLDLSAGGVRIKTTESLNIDTEYDLSIKLVNDNYVKCQFEPIKLEKSEEGIYTIAGRFKNQTRTDRMKIIQFCIRKDIENQNR